jgi:hypothetical protein
MNREDVSHVEKKQPRKYKPKRKVSELDEATARVSQYCLVHKRVMLIVHLAETNSDSSCSASLPTTQQRHNSIIECTDQQPP